MRRKKRRLFTLLLIALVSIGAHVFTAGSRDPFSKLPPHLQYRWSKVTREAPFAPRDGAGALVFKDRMWLLGGWNPKHKEGFPLVTNNEVWSSSDGRAWSLEKPNTFLDKKFIPTRDWEGRHSAGCVVFKDKMWIIGGDPIQGHYQSDIWNSTNGKTWHHVNKGRPVPWGPRVLHYTVVFQDRIWVMGGQTLPQFAPANEIYYSDIWTTTDGISWEQIVPAQPSWSPRGMIGGGVVFKDRIWILGGGTYDSSTNQNRDYYTDVWSSADGVHWQVHTRAAPWHPRSYHEVAVYDGFMWILGGHHVDGGNRNDVWFSADGTNWLELPETPWEARHASSIFVHDRSLWVVAGNNMERDVWRLRSPLDRHEEEQELKVVPASSPLPGF